MKSTTSQGSTCRWSWACSWERSVSAALSKRKRRLWFWTASPIDFRISDIGGVDPVSHDNDPRKMLVCARDWLMTVSRRASVPGDKAVLDCFDEFVDALPELARNARLDPDRIQYPDYERLVIAWVKLSRQRGLL